QAGAGTRGPGVVVGRRRGGGDRAGQRRRIRVDLQTPDHRPRPRPGHRDRTVDVGQLRRSDDRDHRGASTGVADHRVLRPRRGPDGGGRRPGPLLHRALAEHSPHPGEPRDARLPAVVGRPGSAGPAPEHRGRPMSTEAAREEQARNRIDGFRRRRPRLLDEVVTLAHGAGGKSSAALTDAVFLDAFRNAELEQLDDAAVLATASGQRLAFSTDSYVVQPLRFPGGSIGELAVHGTVNDLAVSGAIPQWLAAGFVIEEGFPIADLRAIVADMAAAAARAGVLIVTGDTKVVGRGAADGVYITTTGVGVIPEGRHLARERIRVGDKVVLSGSIGAHGMAVMLARGDLAIDADIVSDTAPVHEL